MIRILNPPLYAPLLDFYQHFETSTMEQSLIRPKRIALIDDFFTRGAIMLGAASRIQSEIPDSEIKAFSMVRSITDGEIEVIRAPITDPSMAPVPSHRG